MVTGAYGAPEVPGRGGSRRGRYTGSTAQSDCTCPLGSKVRQESLQAGEGRTRFRWTEEGVRRLHPPSPTQPRAFLPANIALPDLTARMLCPLLVRCPLILSSQACCFFRENAIRSGFSWLLSVSLPLSS